MGPDGRDQQWTPFFSTRGATPKQLAHQANCLPCQDPWFPFEHKVAASQPSILQCVHFHCFWMEMLFWRPCLYGLPLKAGIVLIESLLVYTSDA